MATFSWGLILLIELITIGVIVNLSPRSSLHVKLIMALIDYDHLQINKFFLRNICGQKFE